MASGRNGYKITHFYGLPFGLNEVWERATSGVSLLYLVSTAHLKTHSNIREGISEQWERIASLIPSLIMRRW